MDERPYLMKKPNHLRSASRVPAAPLHQRAVRSTDNRVPFARATRRRGTGLVRTFVVASATLAILVFCFSIYQYSQLDPRDAALIDGVRPPSGDGEFPSTDVASSERGAIGGKTAIGEGERIHLTFYAREGDRAHVELSVSSWTPVAGATNEFLLVRPEIRLRTKSGNGVRVTADQGRLQAPRKAGGGLDLKRGQLAGHVVLMLDRLTESERAKLPPERRDSLDPADVVRIEMDEIDFDLEYSKLIVPGEWHLTARDIVMSAGNLEIRFNEAENRVEYMRTSGGGRIELLQPTGELGLSLAPMNPAGQRSMSLLEWIRASIEARLAATSPDPKKPAAAPAPALAFTDDGVPIVNLDAPDENATKAPERYYARFNGSVEATERVGDADGARLSADTLEIVREFIDLSRPAGKTSTTASTAATSTSGTTGTTTPTATKPRVVLTWNERLLIEPCTEDNVACAGKGRARISASGSPVRITSPDGDAACASLTYDPDGSKVNLAGTGDAPVVVKLGQLGTVIGAAASTERVGDRFIVHVTGPGRLIRNAGTLASKIDKPNQQPGDAAAPASDPATSTASVIAFTDRLDATGRIVRHTRIDFSGRLNTRTERVLEKAVFHGHVRLHEGDATFGADVLTATFARAGGAGGGQSLEHLLASGHATMIQGDDRLTCREIDVSLSTDPSGRTVPRTVTASGDVEAQQGARTIQATDRLVMDFTVIDRPFEPFDLKAAHAKAIAAGRDPASIDWETRKRQYESKPRHQVVAQRLRAFGEVSIVDPDQRLDVAAGELDCTIAAAGGIDTATVLGIQDRPATVRLDALTVTGARIVLNVVDQSASVPGPGRLTFLSFKDLDGRQLSRPMPIAVTWHETMAYRGRENRAEFVGSVHAASGSSTTFDCDRLFVEFEDVIRKAQTNAPFGMMALVRTAVDRMTGQDGRRGAGVLGDQVSKAPTYLQAVGHAVARMETLDPDTGALRSRVHIEGPKLSVNLRTDVSKAQIEGPGTLLIEDYRTPITLAADKAQPPGGMFAIDEHTGSSNTLIEWKTLMWYDFGIQQTRFEGNVRLKYFSGGELARLRGGSTSDTANLPRGRATFLDADVLTIDFLDRNADAKAGSQRRLGQLSADQLRQFQASGHVVLRDDGEGLSLTAGRVVYWKDNNLLGIFGSPTHKAVIITRKPGQLPNQISVEHVYYNLTTGLQEVAQPTAQGR